MTGPRRPRYVMPEDVARALAERGLESAYRERPPYQRNDYIGWINGAKREQTRKARIARMLDELAAGDVYMKMEWRPRRRAIPEGQTPTAPATRRAPARRAADLDLVEPPDREAWRTWLAANHETSPGVWLAIGRKGGKATELTYDHAVEEALCFGWIDSTTRALDDHRFTQLFTPRRPGGTWARSNRERVQRLQAAGLMTPAGLARVEEAKTDGTWTLLEEVEALEIPEDLASALADSPPARDGFAALAASRQKQLLYWIKTAKRPQTRAERIRDTVAAMREGRWPR